MALLMEQGAQEMPSMAGTVREVWRQGGVRALYSGAGVSMTGAAIYCGLKFASYDASKERQIQELLFADHVFHMTLQ
eukprot:g11535.t1